MYYPIVYLKPNLLPRTIRDAMSLTTLVGERYLWVDSLCITQDDPTEMEVMIASMDKIYSNAMFTIIAASGADANAGLPGLQEGSGNVVTGFVEGVQLVKSAELDLSETTWLQRGWTYQEYELSNGCLIFADEMVYCECAKGVWAEDNPTQPQDYTRASHLGARFLACPPYYQDKGDDVLAPQIWEYKNHVQKYTLRDLT